jgi:hypothetical protein
MFADEKASHLFGPALWRACEEVRAFFEGADEGGQLDVGQDQLPKRQTWGPPSGPPLVSPVLVSTEFRLRYLAPSVPQELAGHVDWVDSRQMGSDWDPGYRAGRQDHRFLGEFVQKVLNSAGTVLIVTDQEIIPPTDRRYTLWEVFPSGVVLSLAPLDPAYWGERLSPADRASTMKFRVRAASLGIVGALLGLSRCENPSCYLLIDVDPVTRLDEMTMVGSEHAVASLAGRGFPQPADPDRVEQSHEMGGLD